MRWPFGVESDPRSSRSCMTMAVEVRTKPVPATNEIAGENPMAMPTSMSAAMQTPTWARPRPKISRRMPQSRDGSISSPMMNRNITTPSSATCRMAWASENRPRPNGPMASPATR